MWHEMELRPAMVGRVPRMACSLSETAEKKVVAVSWAWAWEFE